jgi:DNA-binding CsgD family transcriptional regulator
MPWCTPVIAALGEASFAAELVAALNRRVPIDHVCLMRFVDRERPPVLESASWRGGDRVGEVQQAYLAGLYRQDPNLQLPAAPGLVLRLLRSAAIEGDAYRATHREAGLLERLTVAASAAEQLVALNLYRLASSGPFGAAELQAIDTQAPLLAALALERIEALATRLHAVGSTLTQRERAVLARVLAGMTSEGIALDLGIGLASVLTYRKRAYARLGVTSQAELFALCL